MRVIAAAVLLGVVLLVLLQPVLFARWDQRTKDLLTRWAGGGEPSNHVAIVAIDDRTLAQYGRWPWPRARLAGLLQSIQRDGPDTVVLDMMFPEPDVAKPELVDLPNDGRLPAHATTNDDVLADILRAGRFVVGFHFSFATDQTDVPGCRLIPLRLTTIDTESTRGTALFAASAASCSVEQLGQASLAHGFLNAAPDVDGVLRRIPLAIEYRGSTFPSLALAAYLASRRARDVQLWTSSSGARSVRVEGVEIPVDSRGSLLLRFRKPGGFARFSASDVLKGRVPDGALRGKIVLVGVSAVGLQDVVATPIDPLLPGVEVQATAIDNLLNRDSYEVPRAALVGELVLLFFMALISALLISHIDLAWAPLAIGSLLGAVWLACLLIVRTSNVLVSPFPATLVLLGNLALLSTWRLITEKSRAEQQLRITRQFITQVLTSLTRVRDLETGAHITRVQHYVKILCEAIALDPKYRRLLTTTTIQLIFELIPLHDIGKVAIPDNILRFPGRLPPSEYELIKTHARQGYEVFADAARHSGLKDTAALRLARDIILAHHERWNGTGYPLGLAGENIPLVARITAVADVYDAVVCQRVYKQSLGHDTAVEFIVSNRGVLFDPVVVDAFLKVQNDIRAIMTSLADGNARSATDVPLSI